MISKKTKPLSQGLRHPKRYCMSFTTGSLLQMESVKIASQYIEHRNWDIVRETVVKTNLLQARTQTSLNRLYREIAARLKTLSLNELIFFVNCSFREQGYLLWIAVCRRYKFIGEFALEVLREHYINLKLNLDSLVFDIFFAEKSEWHPELERIQPTTRLKLRQVLFRMLREADLLTETHSISAPLLSPQFLQFLAKNGHQDISFFPIFKPYQCGIAQ